jgi:thiol-disulfide isomerase/thioredoxin
MLRNNEENNNEENNNEKHVATADMLRFKGEYEALNGSIVNDTLTYKTITIPEFNLIKYVTPEEILKIAENGTGLIYFGFPQCPWCRQMMPLLIDIALDMGLDTIYYLDLLHYNIRTTWQLDENGVPEMIDSGHDRYQDLLTAFHSVLEPLPLNPFHLRDASGNWINTGEMRIFVPTVVAIRNGEIVASHVYTVPASFPLNATNPDWNPNDNQWQPLSAEETQELRTIYENVIAALSGSGVCTETAC